LKRALLVTTIAALIDRICLYLQDSTHEAWPLVQVEAQLREAMAQLGRQQLLGEVTWQQGVAGEPEYVFADTTVTFAEVLYDGRSLRPVQEDALTRLRRDWDRATGTPQYFTVPLEPPQTLRLIPAPLSSGSPTLITPPKPIAGQVEDNLVAFTWRNLQESAATDFALPEVLEDVVVFMTVGALTNQDSEYHDKSKGQCFETLVKIILTELLGGTS
jgi:hypothetical protein